jgi:nitroreductase
MKAFVKRFFLLIKHLVSNLQTAILSPHIKMADESLQHQTRILVHAYEKTQTQENLIVMLLQLYIVGTYYLEAKKRGLFSPDEALWADRIIFGEDNPDTGDQDTKRQEKNVDDSALMKVIRERRSIRVFREEPVDESVIQRAVEAMTWSPSACNRQPWRVFTLRTREELEFFGQIKERWLGKVPSAFLMIISKHAYDEVDIHYTPYFDAGIALQNMGLALWDMGYGSAIINLGRKEISDSNRKKIFKKYQIKEEDWLLGALLPFGVPKRIPKPPGRKTCINDLIDWSARDTNIPNKK